MKKLFTIFTILLLSASLSYGATTTTYNAKQQLKQNLNKTKTDFQSAVKSDIENAKKQNTIQTNQKKQEKINKIDQKINQLNKNKLWNNFNFKIFPFKKGIFFCKYFYKPDCLEYHNNRI